MGQKRLGIVGGGQLGYMLTLAAVRMGIPVTVLDPTEGCPATHAGAQQILGNLYDARLIRSLALQARGGVTVEIEHVGVNALRELEASGYQINPSPQTLEMICNKYTQHLLWASNNLPTPEVMIVEDSLLEAVQAARRKWGLQCVVKTRFEGFDGRGTAFITSDKDVEAAQKKLGDTFFYLEQHMPVAREIAVIMYRDLTGKVGAFPVIETFQQGGICHHAVMLGPTELDLSRRALELGHRVMELLKGRGVFTIEMFVGPDGNLSINEVAPRVHNAGHLTVEGCTISQFEQHVRCVMGWPAMPAHSLYPEGGVAMVNVLGTRQGTANPAGWDKAMEIPGVSITLYWKEKVRKERKMGHIVCVDPRGPQYALKGAQEARRRFTI